MKSLSTVDKYIDGFPETVQLALKQMRDAILEAAPQAEECISYGMPAYKLNGILVYFAGYKNHVGFYALPTAHAEFKDALANYKVGKGSVQFPLDRPLPLALIKRMVKFRVDENLKRTKPNSRLK